jgi:high-affinity Fe2+/Pb2+ permease
MSTLKFAARLIAYVGGLWFLLLFVPWSLNARSSLVNGLGVATIISMLIAVAVWQYHKRANKNWPKRSP